VVAARADWERWGFEGTLQPVVFQGDVGEYFDPCAWVEHLPGAPLYLPDTQAIKTHLRRYLPEYMVPERVTFTTLPRTAAGKLDLRALAVPEAAPEEKLALEGAVEEQVAAIWRRVLQVQDIGARCDFFDLGGHSIRAVQMLARIEEELGTKIALRELFEDATVRGLARRIGARK
jgi:acyl carrier protein